MKAELIPVDGGTPLKISKDVTVVGRREYCDLQVDDPSLSKRHCVLVKTDGLLVIRDLATTNGTKVKGQKIRWAALLPDDRIALGSIKFKVYLGPDDAPSPSEAAKGAGPRPAAVKPRSPAARPIPDQPGAAIPGPSRALSAKPAPAVRKPSSDYDLPLDLDGQGWVDAARAGVADDDDDDDLIIDLD